MRIVTAEQMREMDRRAIQDVGMPGSVLMENAGAAVLEAIVNVYGSIAGKKLAVYCGTGNNGGDGYVIARRAALLGALPTVFMLSTPDRLTGDALAHYTVLQRSGCAKIVPFDALHAAGDLAATFDIIIDAMLGTGLNKAPRANFEAAIRRINGMKLDGGKRQLVVAVDVPSGLDSDSGSTPGEVVSADLTVTFARPKVGLYLPPGDEAVGNLVIVDIGYRYPDLEVQPTVDLNLPNSFKKLFASRRPESNKGDFGHVGIIAGSRGMTGAPTLAAMAAQRSGAGLVTVLTPAGAQPGVSAKLNEQMTIPLPDDLVTGTLGTEAYEPIMRFAERASVLCIGPGLTTFPGVESLVVRLLSELDKPVVLDADGLNIAARHPEIAALRTTMSAAPWIMTPHPGEAARLLGTSVDDVQSNRLHSVRLIAAKYRAVVILKGRYTLIASPDGAVCVNTTGNPGMASGGMGDTLTGIIGGLVAQSVGKLRCNQSDAFRIACAAVYLHGLAGDIGAGRVGETALIAGDLVDSMPEAIVQLTQV